MLNNLVLALLVLSQVFNVQSYAINGVKDYKLQIAEDHLDKRGFAKLPKLNIGKYLTKLGSFGKNKHTAKATVAHPTVQQTAAHPTVVHATAAAATTAPAATQAAVAGADTKQENNNNNNNNNNNANNNIPVQTEGKMDKLQKYANVAGGFAMPLMMIPAIVPYFETDSDGSVSTGLSTQMVQTSMDPCEAAGMQNVEGVSTALIASASSACKAQGGTISEPTNIATGATASQIANTEAVATTAAGAGGIEETRIPRVAAVSGAEESSLLATADSQTVQPEATSQVKQTTVVSPSGTDINSNSQQSDYALSNGSSDSSDNSEVSQLT